MLKAWFCTISVFSQVPSRAFLRDLQFTPVYASTFGAKIFPYSQITLEGFEKVMFAIGRHPNTKTLGLDKAGVK